jgi:hypothetical protein
MPMGSLREVQYADVRGCHSNLCLVKFALGLSVEVGSTMQHFVH